MPGVGPDPKRQVFSEVHPPSPQEPRQGRFGVARQTKVEVFGRAGPRQAELEHDAALEHYVFAILVDYACSEAITKVGAIGIKVWIYKGMYGEEPGPELAAPGDRFRRRGRR